MRGDPASVGNIQEVGRLLRLEKLKADFNRAVFNIAIFILLLILIYISLIKGKTTMTAYPDNSMMISLSLVLQYFTDYEGMSIIIMRYEDLSYL